MPFTPFHLGPAILLGILLVKYVDFPTFVAANLLVDWRATLVFFGIIDGPLHSWPSTYPGSLLTAAFLAVSMIYIRPLLDNQLREAGIVQAFDRKSIFIAAFLGVIIHVTLDAFHHPMIDPFLIEGFKPLYGLLSTTEVRLLCTSALVASIPVYLYHVRDKVLDRE